ncbi:hypothetical protein DRO55_03835 [Candidatus Bathyarchaeota archaeon]|nr:MAG: hypothetical protein DRO55_03835 [Candidatus Bathyarchaeota archaeon]
MYRDEGQESSERPRRARGKVSAAIGGFLIVVSMILLGVFALSLLNLFDPNLLMRDSIQCISMWILLIIGILDLLSGIILLFG